MRFFQDILKDIDRKTLLRLGGGGVVLLGLCIVVFVLIITGKTRRNTVEPAVVTEQSQTSSTAILVPRHLDGEMVVPEEAALEPWAVMIDHQVAARPQSGVAAARVVIESPVEGGITRLLALYAPTSTISEIGPVRSARPYFVDWAYAWNAMYVHVGGSPEALERIRSLGERFHDANEMANGWAFWRDSARVAPHSTMTNGERLLSLAERKGFASSTIPLAWHFLESSTSSTQLGGVARIVIPYGGSYSVVWRFDKDQNRYQRSVAGRKVVDRGGEEVYANNVIVLKTEEQVLDEQGRLRIRTTGSGDALGYRDGNKYILRWRRSPGEPLRFETIDGVEFLLRPGKTWIQVTTSDIIFAGVE